MFRFLESTCLDSVPVPNVYFETRMKKFDYASYGLSVPIFERFINLEISTIKALNYFINSYFMLATIPYGMIVTIVAKTSKKTLV